MSILTGAAYSFKAELLLGIHNLAVGGDTLKIALYASSANLGPWVTTYSASGEVTDPNWLAGGQNAGDLLLLQTLMNAHV